MHEHFDNPGFEEPPHEDDEATREFTPIIDVPKSEAPLPDPFEPQLELDDTAPIENLRFVTPAQEEISGLADTLSLYLDPLSFYDTSSVDQKIIFIQTICDEVKKGAADEILPSLFQLKSLEERAFIHFLIEWARAEVRLSIRMEFVDMAKTDELFILEPSEAEIQLNLLDVVDDLCQEFIHKHILS